MKKVLAVLLVMVLALGSMTALAEGNTEFQELSKGSKGDAVVELQERLNAFGYSVGTVDGDFGGKTTAAIEQFQTDNGLTVTGRMDESTYNALFAIAPGTKAVDMWGSDNSMMVLTDDGIVRWFSWYDDTLEEERFDGYRLHVYEKASDVAYVARYGGLSAHNLYVLKDGSLIGTRGTIEYGDEWNDLVLVDITDAVDSNDEHMVGLKKDGSWITDGDYRNGECDVEGWTDIIQLGLGTHFTVGLKSDGTVVATGTNFNGQCDVSGWQDIKKISVGSKHTLGLKSDGTVVATGDDSKDQCMVGRWKNVIDICASGSVSYGLTEDGEILTTGQGFGDDFRCDGAVEFAAPPYSGGYGGWYDGACVFTHSEDGSLHVYGQHADYYMHLINGLEPSSENDISTTEPMEDDTDDVDLKAVGEALGEVDTDGNGQIDFDEIFEVN